MGDFRMGFLDSLKNSLNKLTQSSQKPVREPITSPQKREDTGKENAIAFAKEVVKFWYTLEFMSQPDLPHAGEKYTHQFSLKDVPSDVPFLDYVVNQMFGSGKKLPESIKKATIYIGKISRETCMDTLDTLMKSLYLNPPERPEINVESLAGAVVDVDLQYKLDEKSLQYSPALWAIKQIGQASKKDASHFISGRAVEKYEGHKKERQKDLQKQMAELANQEGLVSPELALKQKSAFVVNTLKNIKRYLEREYSGLVKPKENWVDYNTITVVLDDGSEKNSSMANRLQKSFFIKDLKLILDKMEKSPEDFKTDQIFIKYLLSPTDFVSKDPRIDIIDDDVKELENIYARILAFTRAPLAKWPSQFAPALMQQFAVNMAAHIVNPEADKEAPACMDYNGPIFSVNGPPGTGKTTLLKEVIVNNIVERAHILADKYDSPDKAFRKKEIDTGEKSPTPYYVLKDPAVVKYGMLVTSSNNTAVENITKKVPTANEMQDDLGLAAYQKAVEHVRNRLVDTLGNKDIALGDKSVNLAEDTDWTAFLPSTDMEKMDGYLEDLQNLQNLTEAGEADPDFTLLRSRGFAMAAFTQPDIYFTAEETNLLNEGKEKKGKDQKEAWGLFSAPLGKGKNLRAFGALVLQNLFSHPSSQGYGSARTLFLKHYELVKEKRSQLWKQAEADFKVPVADLKSTDSKKKSHAHAWNPLFQGKEFEVYNAMRELLFYDALKFMEAFVLHSSSLKADVGLLLRLWHVDSTPLSIQDTDEKRKKKTYQELGTALLQALSLIVPVVSTTFASVESFLKNVVKPNSLGMLIVDEAGQAPPMVALGALYRSSSAMIVGDPKQIAPVVTDELEQIKKFYRLGKRNPTDGSFEPEPKDSLEPYKDSKDSAVQGSVQSFADGINHFGTCMENENDWVGSPLLVHRRCASPMYDISNDLSYGGKMLKGTGKVKKTAEFLSDYSLWIDVPFDKDNPERSVVK